MFNKRLFEHPISVFFCQIAIFQLRFKLLYM